MKYPKTFVTTPDDTFLAACALVPADHQHAYEAVWAIPSSSVTIAGGEPVLWRSGHGPRGGITIDGLGDLYLGYLNSPAVGSRFCSEHTAHTAMRSSLPW